MMLSYLMVKRLDAGLAVIQAILLSYQIHLGQSDDFGVVGSISINNPSVLYRRGENLTFTFNVTFNVTNDLDTFNVSIWSPTLEFSDTTTQWTLNGLDIDPGLGSEPQLDITSSEVRDEFVDGENAYRLCLTNIMTNVWSFDGLYSMTVKDDVGPGRRIQSFMNLSFPIMEGNSTYTSVLPSKYGYTPPLQASLNPSPSSVISIMESRDINVSLTLQEDNAAPLVEIISPFENTSREVMLTIIDVKVNDTYGLDPDVVQEIAQTEPEIISTLMTYQRDIGSVQLPLLRNAAGANESGLAARFQLRLEDYTVMENGDELLVGAGVKFGDGMIWASDVTLTVDAPDAANRRPDLKLKTSASTVCVGEDRNDVDLVLSIRHSRNSTATAYDLQLNVYPLPSMTRLSSTSIPPQDYPFILNISTYLRLTLGRLTFSDPAVVTLKMRVQMNDSYVYDATDFIVPVELIYNDRWNNSVDTVTPLNYIDIKLNKKCAERYTWTLDSTCTCDFDTNRSDCGCCMDHDVYNITQCGEDNPGVCAPTHTPWLCLQRMDGFLSHSRLTLSGGELYECDASHKYSRQRNSEISCYKRSSVGYQEVHPMVAVILGKDSLTNTLYGVSSTGYAYVISRDAGKSWRTIRESDFLRNTDFATYITADLF